MQNQSAHCFYVVTAYPHPLRLQILPLITSHCVWSPQLRQIVKRREELRIPVFLSLRNPAAPRLRWPLFVLLSAAGYNRWMDKINRFLSLSLSLFHSSFSFLPLFVQCLDEKPFGLIVFRGHPISLSLSVPLSLSLSHTHPSIEHYVLWVDRIFPSMLALHTHTHVHTSTSIKRPSVYLLTLYLSSFSGTLKYKKHGWNLNLPPFCLSVVPS